MKSNAGTVVLTTTLCSAFLALLAMPESQSPEARARGRDLAEALQDALDALRPDYREAVLLRFSLDFRLEEIAEAQGVPLGTVKSRLHHALRALRAAREEK